MVKRARPGKTKYRPPYPLVVCDDHGGDPLPGYAVCVHVIANPKVALGPIKHSSATSLGVVVCADCATFSDVPVEKLTIACAHYVHETFGVPL